MLRCRTSLAKPKRRVHFLCPFACFPTFFLHPITIALLLFRRRPPPCFFFFFCCCCCCCCCFPPFFFFFFAGDFPFPPFPPPMPRLALMLAWRFFAAADFCSLMRCAIFFLRSAAAAAADFRFPLPLVLETVTRRLDRQVPLPVFFFFFVAAVFGGGWEDKERVQRESAVER